MIRVWLVLIQMLSAAPALAAPVTVGQPFPAIAIENIGECVIEGEGTAFRPWHSNRMLGKVQVVEYVAARAGIDAVHRAFFAEVRQARFPAQHFAVTRLVNADDALWGTSGLVPEEIRKNKRQTPDVHLVVDAEGRGLREWRLAPKGAALAILDRHGKVLFFKEGALTDEEIRTSIALLVQQVAAGPD